MNDLEPCCDCGGVPQVLDDNSSGTNASCVKWYQCACGRKSSWRGCATRKAAAKKWNATMRFVVSFRKQQRGKAGT